MQVKPTRFQLASLLFGSAVLLLPYPTQAQTQPAVAAQSPSQASPRNPAPAPAPIPNPAPNPAQPSPSPSRLVIFLDPAHGASDTGAHITSSALEKDLNLTLASRLRPLLVSSGFSVLSSRDNDPADPIPTDLRASEANHSRATACLILHSTAAGSGVHLFTSALQPPDISPPPYRPIPWNRAQALYVDQSLRFANLLGLALLKASLPATIETTSLRPLDNLTCPAVAIEVAPLLSGDKQPPTSPDDATYQQHLAQAIASALMEWRAAASPHPPASSLSTGDAP